MKVTFTHFLHWKSRIFFFLEIGKITEFDNYVKKTVDPKFLNSFTTVHTFNETDQVLQNVVYWPKISDVDYFKTKLKFQIQHSLFRWEEEIVIKCMLNHCFEGPRFKKVEKILKKSWIGTRRSMPRHSNMSPTQYTTLISRTFTGCLFWELFNVHVQWNAAFRWIIGYKNLLRACEFSGRAGILGLEYISSDEFSNAKFEQFLQADVLRREYLNQTFNFLPFLWVNKKN